MSATTKHPWHGRPKGIQQVHLEDILLMLARELFVKVSLVLCGSFVRYYLMSPAAIRETNACLATSGRLTTPTVAIIPAASGRARDSQPFTKAT
jgi:hypothetical protein